MPHSALVVATALLLSLAPTARAADAVKVTIDAAHPKPISPDLMGVFFEDINYAADGGLYAELIQNRSFEYSPLERLEWGPLTCWRVEPRGDGQGRLYADAGRPLHPNNPTYAVFEVSRAGDGVAALNEGFDGVPVTEGAAYDVSLFVRQLYVKRRWGGEPFGPGDEFKLVARLESPDGESLGETTLTYSGLDWNHAEGEIVATRTEPNARFALVCHTEGGVALDVVSLFPRDTFKGRPNGLRKDLAQTIADLKPRFVRFPGGCLVHGNGLGNMYRWKDTVGPVHERRGQRNIWGYHQTVGLGYFEYFQYCEDIGAKPLPVVPAAVSCQNSGATAGMGQEGLPLSQMEDYIQEVVDLVEWANGPADSEWGAVRAAAGHPEPFGLEYLGVGNEDHITPEFEKRFRLIYEALRERCPEITVIGTVGPAPDGPDYEAGWRIADRLAVPMVDEHYYRSPDWFFKNTERYDDYDRAKSAVYLGEYAAHDRGRRSTLRSALAEAAYLTHLERNADIVRLASYAPLLAKRGHTQWRPDLIYFDNTTVSPTINYDVQRLFGEHAGDDYLPADIEGDARGLELSCVAHSESGDRIVKLVNPGDEEIAVEVAFDGAPAPAPRAERFVLAGDPDAENRFGEAPAVATVRDEIEVGTTFGVAAPAHSLTVIRLRKP